MAGFGTRVLLSMVGLVAGMENSAEAHVTLKAENRAGIRLMMPVPTDHSHHGHGLPRGPSPRPRPTTATDIQACVRDVCGPAPGHWGAQDVLAPRLVRSNDFETWWTDRILASARKLHETMDRKNAKAAHRAFWLLQAGRQPRADHPLRAYFAMLQLQSSLDRLLTASLQVQSEFQSRFDLFDFQTALALEPADHREALKTLFDKIYVPQMSVLENSTQGALRSRLTMRLRRVVGAISAEALREDARRQLETMSRLRALLGESLATVLFRNLDAEPLRHAVAGISFDSIQADEYVDAADAVETLQIVFLSSAFEKLMQVPTDHGTALAELRKNAHSPQDLGMEFPLGVESRVAAINGACRTPMAILDASLGSNLRRRKAHAAVREIKDAAKKVIAPLFDPRALPDVENAIEQTEFVFPESSVVLRERTERRLAARLRAERMSAALLEASNADVDDFLLLSLVHPPSGVFSDELETTCENFNLATVNDATLIGEDRIAVSWYSLVYPEVGVGIMAHELGHVVSLYLRMAERMGLSTNTAATTSTCVINRNPFQTASVTPSTTTWSEEDGADHFAAMVLNEMRRRGSFFEKFSRNFACPAVNDTGLEYEEHTLNPAPESPHSSPVLRLLMIGHDRGDLPSSCRRLLDKVASHGRPMRCGK